MTGLLHLKPFEGNSGARIKVHDMDIDYYGDLWVSGGAGIHGFDVE